MAPSAFSSVTQRASTIRTAVTTAHYPYPSSKLQSILESPDALILLNPLVVEVTPFTGSTYTLVDRLTFLRVFSTRSIYTATFEYRRGTPGPEPVVLTRGALGVRTRASWRVDDDPAGCGCTVTEVFEMLEGPRGLRGLLMHVLRQGHRKLLVRMGEELGKPGGMEKAKPLRELKHGETVRKRRVPVKRTEGVEEGKGKAKAKGKGKVRSLGMGSWRSRETEEVLETMTASVGSKRSLGDRLGVAV